MRYNEREIEKDKAYTFTFKYFSDSVQQIPSAATVTIYDAASTTALSTGAGSIDASGTVTYTFSQALNDTEGENFMAKCDATIGSVVETQREVFDVVITALRNSVIDDDLYTYIPDLRDVIADFSGETNGTGTTSTFVDSALTTLKSDYKGGYGVIYIDEDTEHEFKVTSYSDGTVTFAPVYTAAIGTGIRYRIRSSYSEQIEQAFSQVRDTIRNKIGMLARIIDDKVITRLVAYKAISIICAGYIYTQGDKWDIRTQMFDKKYTDALSEFAEPYDMDDSGTIDTDEDSDGNRIGFKSVGAVI